MELHKRRGPLTEPEVRYYMKQLCLGIEFLHKKDIIHRDLKVSLLRRNYKMTSLLHKLIVFSAGKHFLGRKDACQNW